MKKRTSFAGWVVAMLCAGWLGAQSMSTQQQMAKQVGRNQEELQKHTWTSKYTYTIDGVQKRVDVYSVRYAVGGMRQRMQISSEVDKTKVRRPDGKKLKKKEREAAYEFVMEVKSQLDGYLNPMFAEKAVATATTTTSGDTLVLQASDVVTDGDTVEIHLSHPGLLPQTAVIATTVEGSPVSLEVEFDSLEYGPNYPARSVTKASWQGFQLEIRTESSDYEKVRR